MKKLLSIVIAYCLFTGIAQAQELTVIDLKWTHKSQIEGQLNLWFRAYYGPSFDMYLEVVELDHTFNEAEEYYFAELEILTEDMPAWVVVTAYNTTRESIHSNELCFGTDEECGNQPDPPQLISNTLNQCERLDVNEDGVVGGQDFIIFANHWGWQTGDECIEY